MKDKASNSVSSDVTIFPNTFSHTKNQFVSN